jgi:hypothetical protein
MHKEITLKNWKEISLQKTGHEWEGNIKMGKKEKVSNTIPYSRGLSLVLQVDSSEYGNEHLGSISSGKFYD